MNYNQHLNKLKEEFQESWISSWVTKIIDPAPEILRWTLILGVSAYALATIIHTLSVHLLLQNTPQTTTQNRTTTSSSTPQLALSHSPSFNYFDFHRNVLQRNLFNSLGEVPQGEDAPNQQKDNSGSCTPTTLSLRLSGTLLHEDPLMSVATLVDLNHRLTDSYRQGDRLLDHPATVLSIERNRIILDHQGKRECLEITSQDKGGDSNYSASLAPPPERVTGLELATSPAKADETSSASGDKVVVLKDSYVEGQLGEGFAKIIQAARLVPKQDASGNPEGFRIFSIKPGTILTRIGLKNGDVLNQINSTSLTQPEEGFALYQALQDENEITIYLKREGKPQTIKVRVE